MDLGIGGRGCVVTGASRGIGRETARQLCAEGASVLLVARGADALARRRLPSAGGAGAEALALDVTAEDAGERMLAAASESFGALDVLVNNAGSARWRDLDEVPDEDWRAQYEINVMAPLRAMRAAAPAMAERGWGRIVNVCSTAGKRPSAAMPEYSVAKSAELSLSRLFADRHARSGVLVNAICPGPVDSELWMEPGGLLDQSQRLSGAGSREEALEAAGAETADRPPRRGRRDRLGDRLPLLRARLLRQRRRLVGRRRHRPGDHLTDLAELLLSPEEARTIEVRGDTDAAVLLPLYGWPEKPGLIFTERRADLRRHAGEISFPGGRQDPDDPDLTGTALREAEEEIGLAPASVELSGALPPTSTFVTGYRIHPFVGRIPDPSELDLRPSPDEVETLLTFSLDVLDRGYAMRRLIRRGIPIHTPTYEVEGHLIWGATARILAELLDRLG